MLVLILYSFLMEKFRHKALLGCERMASLIISAGIQW